MSKHTQGPWFTRKFTNVQKNTEFIEIHSFHQKVIARIRSHPGDAPMGKCLSEYDLGNARLIAAAPEMLEALKSMYLFISTYGGEVSRNFEIDGENGDYYRNLISKAEGEEK